MMPSHLATFDKELPPGDAAGSVPAWVHLLSSGRATARDGRQFTLANPEAVIDAFVANNIDLPVDYEHQADKAESRLKGPVPAAGWIKSLEMRENGLWGQVEWTATAARMIAAKEYRTISPSIVIDAETKEILRLNGAGLVHHPALELTALAEETAVPENSDRDLLSEAVKLLFDFPTDTTSAEVLAAVVKMVAIFRTAAGQQVSKLTSETASLLELSGLAPSREEIVLAETVASLERQREEAVAELRSERITSKVAKAAQQGFITNGMRKWATALCQSDEASFDAYCSGVPTFAYLMKPQLSQAYPDRVELLKADEEASVRGQLGLKPGALRL